MLLTGTEPLQLAAKQEWPRRTEHVTARADSRGARP